MERESELDSLGKKVQAEREHTQTIIRRLEEDIQSKDLKLATLEDALNGKEEELLELRRNLSHASEGKDSVQIQKVQ